MKNLKIFNIIFALIFMISACDKTYDDIYDAIDETNEEVDATNLLNSDKLTSLETYTMIDVDYELLKTILLESAITEEDSTIAEDIFTNKSFDDDILPQDYLPIFLDETYYSETPGTEMIVGYNYYRGKNEYVDEFDDDNYIEYELDDADYIDIGTDALALAENEDDSTAAQSIIDNKYFKSGSQNDFLPAFVADKYTGAVENDYAKINFKYNSGGTTWERYYIYYYVSGEWERLSDAYDLAPEDYDALGDGYGEPGQNDNFTSSSDASVFISAFLNMKFINAGEGDMKQVIYSYFSYDDYSTTNRMKEFVYDGSDWAEYVTTVEEASIFKFTNEGWLFVPPLKFVETTAAATRTYELTDADYELVGDGKYKNFTIEDGGIVEKISKILKANFNDLVVGDIFKVIYKGYDGGVDEYTINLEVQLDE